uniref:Uncharacterized protein n=1 Tax=Arundo donax TaxID=35708 RepID=A0A0A8YMG7_ARUDO
MKAPNISWKKDSDMPYLLIISFS